MICLKEYMYNLERVLCIVMYFVESDNEVFEGVLSEFIGTFSSWYGSTKGCYVNLYFQFCVVSELENDVFVPSILWYCRARE